jgi:hypothetical protein
MSKYSAPNVRYSPWEEAEPETWYCARHSATPQIRSKRWFLAREMSRPHLTRVQARNCFLANQFATPGMGSVMARRWFQGGGQLLVFLTGFGICCVGFVRVCGEAYRNFRDGTDLGTPSAKLMLLGIGIAFVAWVWALFTSLSLRRQAATDELQAMDAVETNSTPATPEPPVGPPPVP